MFLGEKPRESTDRFDFKSDLEQMKRILRNYQALLRKEILVKQIGLHSRTYGALRSKYGKRISTSEFSVDYEKRFWYFIFQL